MIKSCTKCRQDKSIESFTKDKTKADGLRPSCRECDKSYYWHGGGRERSKSFREQYPEKQKVYRDKGYLKNREKLIRVQGERREKLKVIVYDAYGGAICACCGETNMGFLSIDHINGITLTERALQMKSGSIYMWLKKHDYPEGYQILCFNCNLGRARNKGICPHKITA